MQDLTNQLYQQFIHTSFIEWVATISGFLCVYLAAKQNILTWPISILSVLLYLYIFYQNKLYGASCLQLYFLSTAVYGWYYWNKTSKSAKKQLTSFARKDQFFTLCVIAILALILGYVLDHYTDTDVPYIDGFCTSISLVAQFLMTRKVIQHWILWIIVDLCYIPLYFYKDLLITAILYLTLAVLSINGFREWKKSVKNFQ